MVGVARFGSKQECAVLGGEGGGRWLPSSKVLAAARGSELVHDTLFGGSIAVSDVLVQESNNKVYAGKLLKLNTGVCG